ncbi:hypothetical protein [Desulfobacter sp.]|uniref:hypothetical protein n=1 Tax=Desulfobacter sp. TaxID=2294 RepID=UPI003D0998D1
MAGIDGQIQVEVGRLLKIIGGKEVELDVCREKVMALTTALDKADAELTKVRVELEGLKKTEGTQKDE